MNPQGMDVQQIEPAVPVQVTGWLLFLCLILTFVYPVQVAYQIFWRTVPNLLHAHTPARIFLLGVYSVLFSCVAAFSFIAGLKLWLVKSGAVRFARQFFLTYLIANFAYFVCWIIIRRPNQSAAFAEMGWYHVIGPIPFFALWYFYLEHSKRVRATYSA